MEEEEETPGEAEVAMEVVEEEEVAAAIKDPNPKQQRLKDYAKP